MKKIIILVIIAIMIIVFSGIFTGIIPVFSLLENGTNTQNKIIGEIKGYGELIGPNNRKGFIISYKNDGFSETIVARGQSIGVQSGNIFTTTGMTKYKYTVYGKRDANSNYEKLSEPGTTSKYLSNPNPGECDVTGTHYNQFTADKAYEFSFVGNTYSAVKIVFEGWIDWNVKNPFDDGYRWRELQIDEAFLYEGWGGLYLPRDTDGKPRSTFEIGEKVNIGVETTYGGQAVGEGKTWRVAMKYPADRGGEVYKEEDYGDNVNSYFTFTVTENMFSTNSNNRYTIEIYNTLVKEGTLLVNTIDVLAKAPSDVTFSGGSTQCKVGSTYTINLNAERNSETQLAIDHFEVSVIYGNNNVLLPSDPNSHNWIIHTTDFKASGSGNSYSCIVSFKPEVESFITIHAKAYDTEGRASKTTKTWTLWAYADVPVPDETIDDETGENDYGGGHTNPWLPWDPGGGNWGEVNIPFSLIGIIISIIVLLVFLIIGLIIFKGNIYYVAAVAIIGLIIAIFIYFYFFTDVLTNIL